METTITIKKGLKKDLPVLDIGEFALCTDTFEVYVGTPLGNVGVLLEGAVPGGIVNQRTGVPLAFWMGSSEQFSNLAARDANTVYLIQDAWLGAVKFGNS